MKLALHVAGAAQYDRAFQECYFQLSWDAPRSHDFFHPCSTVFHLRSERRRKICGEALETLKMYNGRNEKRRHATNGDCIVRTPSHEPSASSRCRISLECTISALRPVHRCVHTIGKLTNSGSSSSVSGSVTSRPCPSRCCTTEFSITSGEPIRTGRCCKAALHALHVVRAKS